MLLALTFIWLLLGFTTYRHPRFKLLFLLESVCLLGCALYILDAKFGSKETTLPWRVYVDQSASMSWGKRNEQVHQWAKDLPADIVYFDTEISKVSKGPIGISTNVQSIYNDWLQVSNRYTGVVLLSDGVFSELPSQYRSPWNCVQVTSQEPVIPPLIESEDTAEIGKPLSIKTNRGASLWVNGEKLANDGTVTWTPQAAGKAYIYAQEGKGISTKTVNVVSPEPPYVLRIIAGVDPAVPIARDALIGTGIHLLQWNGSQWRWKGKTYDTPLWSSWWGQAEWVWLDSDTWLKLPEDAQRAIWEQWRNSSLGVYFADRGVVTDDWQKILPGRKGQKSLWGFDSDWGSSSWTSSEVLTNLTHGAQTPGPGFSYHTIGKHRIAQHTGLDWSVALATDTSAFWKRLSHWLAEGKRPQAQIYMDGTLGIQHTSRVNIQVRDNDLSQVKVLVSPLMQPEGTKLLPVLPENLHSWKGFWTPDKAGLYKITVTGSSKNGTWTIDDVYNVPPAVDELMQGQYPKDSTMLHIAAASKGSYQKDNFQASKLIRASQTSKPYYVRDYPYGLFIIGTFWLLSWFNRLKYRR